VMSKQAAMQKSFSIRFKPASAVERKDEHGSADDLCDIGDVSASHGGSCEAVLFERQCSTEELAPAVDCAECNPTAHPGDLWEKSQAILSHSAPVSELTSPMSPSAANASAVTDKKPTTVKSLTGSQPLADKLSIFSGLKEKLDKLSTESKEIFDRKMKRSGSADAVKIASLLASPAVTKTNPEKDEATGENTGFVARSADTNEQKLEVAEPSNDRDSSVSACSGNFIHKSNSSIEVARADIGSVSAAKPNRVSLGNECGQESVVMSRLLSTTSKSDSRQYFATGANVSVLCESSKNVDKNTERATDGHVIEKPRSFFSDVRFQYMLSLLVAVVAYIIVPMPPYVSGMLVGAFLSAVSILLYQRLTRSRPGATVSSQTARASAHITADIRESKSVEEKFKVCEKMQDIMFAYMVE